MLLLDQLIENNEPIWVRNIYRPRGIIMLTMIDASGKTQKVVIPNTKYPICLSQLCTRDMIAQSFDLRTFINKGVIELVEDKHARELVDNPDVQELIRKSFKDAGIDAPHVLRTRGDTESDVKILSEDAVTAKAVSSADDLVDENSNPDLSNTTKVISETPGVQNRVVVLMEALRNREMRARAAKDELEGLNLSEEDLKYVVDNSTGIVETWAKNQLVD